MRVLLGLLFAPFLAAPSIGMEPDQLAQIGPVLAVIDRELVFDYASPQDGFDEPGMAWGIYDTALASMLASGRTDAETGIDFSSVSGVLMAGTPPRQMTVLIGSNDAFTQVADTLEAAGLRQRDILDTPAWGDEREDYSVDMNNRNSQVPFDGGLGNSRRFAMPGANTLVNASGWPTIEAALAAARGPMTPAGALWSQSIDALGTDRPGAWVELASGFLASTAGGSPDMASLPLSEDPLKSLAKTLADSDFSAPPYPFVVLAQLATESGSLVALATPYPDRNTAEAAAAGIADRLADWPEIPSEPQVSVLEGPDAAIAVVSVPVDDDAARDLYVEFYVAIARREFTPLNFY
jgi:hypothetical protein